VGQRQLDCLSNFLLLDIETSYIGKADIGPLVLRQQRNADEKRRKGGKKR